METEDREALEILVKAEEGTASSLMTFDFISCPESHTVKQAFQVLRERADDVESIAYIYCVDSENRLAGVVSLRDLIISYENAPLSEIMHPRLAALSADDDWKTVAEQFFKYKFRALPVVDPDRHIAGIVTFMHSFEELIPYYHKLID
jgi:magnesium transporter